MLAHYLSGARPETRHGLPEPKHTLGYSPVSIEELIGKKGKEPGQHARCAIGEK
jgi:hypothetical protein